LNATLSIEHKTMRNLFPYEHHIRLLSGIILLGLASSSNEWVLITMGIVLIYTGATQYCPIFHVLGINTQSATNSYHLSLIPAHNPEPVYLFNRHGDLVFRNAAAKNILPKLTSMSDLHEIEDHTDFNVEHGLELLSFHENNHHYLLNFDPIPDTELIAAYGFDVTNLLKAREEIIKTQKELIFRMGEIGETRSRETGNHVKRVAEYSKQLALLSGLRAEDAELLKMASPMHDIGKVAIPDSVLLKPGKLNEQEWEIMKTHAAIGYDLLKHSDRPILKAAAIVAGQHHEKWDGSGYPNGLVGRDIHIYGRITALADVFDALGSERVYKQAWPLEKILELLEQEKGRHFDPQLIELFRQNLPLFLAIRDKFQDQSHAHAIPLAG